VAERFELECGVLDVEVSGQALLQLIEQCRQVHVVEARVVDLRGEYRQSTGD
jgi:hypothetical protein